MDAAHRAPLNCVFKDVANPRLQYAKDIEIDVSLRDSTEQYVTPVNGINNDGPFEFNFEPIRDTVLAMDQLLMYVRAEVEDGKGNTLSTESDVIPINYLLNTMFRSVEVRVNGHPIHLSASQNTAYKSIMQAYLSMDSNSVETLAPSLFYPESSDQSSHDLTGRSKSNNIRREMLNLGSQFEMIGPISCCDFLQSDAYLAPFNALTLTFTRHDDEFIFMTPKSDAVTDSQVQEMFTAERDEYTEAMREFEPYVRREKSLDYNDKHGIFGSTPGAGADQTKWKTVSPWSENTMNIRWEDGLYFYSLSERDWDHITDDNTRNTARIKAAEMILKLTSLRNRMDKYRAGRALHPKLKIKEFGIFARRIELSQSALRSYFEPKSIQRYLGTVAEVHSHALVTGITRKTLTVYSSGILPKQVVVGMVETAATVGHYQKNPLDFQTFGVNNIALNVNAVRVPMEPMKPEFDKNLYMRSYVHMLMNSGSWKTKTNNCITPSNFRRGATLFPFDLCEDLCGSAHVHSGKEGFIQLELGFAKPLDKQITVFIMTCKDHIVTLDPASMGTPSFNAF